MKLRNLVLTVIVITGIAGTGSYIASQYPGNPVHAAVSAKCTEIGETEIAIMDAQLILAEHATRSIGQATRVLEITNDATTALVERPSAEMMDVITAKVLPAAEFTRVNALDAMKAAIALDKLDLPVTDRLIETALCH